MEPDPGKIRGIGNIKKEIKNGSVMPAHVACAKRTCNVLALLTKNCNVIFSWTLLL